MPHKSRARPALGLWIVSFVSISLLLFSPYFAFAQQSSVEVRVFKDGVVTVIHTINLNETIPALPVKLLSRSVEGVLVLDDRNLPVAYDLSASEMTVRSLGATKIIIEYDTSALTSKNGSIWTLSLNAPFEVVVMLPHEAAILSMSDVPKSIANNGTRTVLTLGSGSWQISYLQSAIPPSTTPEQQVTPPSPFRFDFLTLALLVAIGAAGGVAGRWWGHRSKARIASESELRPEDQDVLRFIEENGGKVLEVELSKRFALPKTTMWRLVRRLERASRIKISKIGLQNQIELVK